MALLRASAIGTKGKKMFFGFGDEPEPSEAKAAGLASGKPMGF